MEQIYYFLDPIQYADTFESNLNKGIRKISKN